MAINKTDAVILHSRKQGETSKILTVYTEQFGKQRLMAKGSRGTKSRYLGVLETLNHISVIVYRNENRDIQYISQADLVERFPDIHENLGKLALAAIPCEIIDRAESLDHKNQPLFHLLLDTLHALERSSSGLKNMVRYFYVQYMKISGVQPEFSACASCGEFSRELQYTFDLENGNLVCSDCREVAGSSIVLSGQSLAVLQWLDQVDLDKVIDKPLPAGIGVELDNMLIPYLSYHVEGLLNLRSLEHLRQLQEHLKKSG